MPGEFAQRAFEYLGRLATGDQVFAVVEPDRGGALADGLAVSNCNIGAIARGSIAGENAVCVLISGNATPKLELRSA